MRLILISSLLLATVPFSALAQKKEMIELGRDLALLQEEVRTMQKSQNDKLSNIEGTLKAIQDQIAASSRAITLLDSGLKDRMEKSMSTPLSGLGGKVDTLGQDFGYVRESVTEINTRLGKLDQKIADLSNTIKTMQAPPPAPAGLPATASGPPPGVSSQSLYQDAMRDKSGGNLDLALKEFNDYVAWFGDTDLAPNAQYYVGEILYNQKQYEQALVAFDRALEAYPKNVKTADAHLMKGRTLLKMARRSDAEQEFRAAIAVSPSSDAAGRAKGELRDLGLSTAPRPAARKR
ncbi:MAG: tetratricopeptide repeat protein [Bryobacterales bacterium]|nr:tetratricopeptide repeat protein [Bryobacterales bacterium]